MTRRRERGAVDRADRAVRALDRAVVFGGYGIFGRLVAAELAAVGAQVRIAGRDAGRAERTAAALGGDGISADAEDSSACARALAGAQVAVDCAGPFGRRSLALAEACLA